MNAICIREFGLLIQGEAAGHGLEVGGIASSAAWAFLENLAFSNEKKNRFIEAAAFKGRKALRVLNFVGVITTPDGTQIEILPKTSEYEQDVKDTRQLLWKMLCRTENLTCLESTDALLMLREQRLPDALICVFLHHCAALVRRGIHKDYERIASEEPFLRGRLNLTRQLRQAPGRRHMFQIEYDIFSDNRAENRLLHAALRHILGWSTSEYNQRLARELRDAFDRVPVSSDHAGDFYRWRTGRDMIHYQPVLPWIRLILNMQSPFAIRDQHAGISLLFPMEQLFEKYVAHMLRAQLASRNLLLRTRLQDHHLSLSPLAFLLKPDMGIYSGKQLACILDTKWKLIDQEITCRHGSTDPKSGINQPDMYQLYAYGQRYLGGKGPMALIYPKWTRFDAPLTPFDLGGGLTLSVLPYDMQSDVCDGLMALL
ncbi:McrC family protein [Massilia scottii]|uniref:McrC family protein n=1 Tax=Massilia scottii TaxID=3057166 RepID=UPI002796DD65|nr:McrC family protein [Massilia sp. CCM 9029]MDQ1831811.1 McrC family protein [Massilia sp. CCM 9029]